MITNKPFYYTPGEHELEKASNSYLMTVVAAMVGTPLPIINLIASVIFYLGNRNGTYFVRWHATQMLIGQIPLVIINSIGITWALSLFYGEKEVPTLFIIYATCILIINLIEFVVTVISADRVRKGRHVEWFFFGDITHQLVKPDPHNSLDSGL